MIDRLAPEQKQAGAAAAGLALTLFLPWYQKNVAQAGRLVSGNLNAFGVASFVEAAIMLVAIGVLVLLWTRAQRRPFHLPGGDGTVIMAAGGWAAFLLVWRLFDKPDVAGPGNPTVGIQWGWFAAMVMATLLAASGARLRAAHRPEPPNPAAAEPAPGRARREPRARPVDHSAVTEVLQDRPAWEDEPPPDAPRTTQRLPTDPRDERDEGQDRLF